MEDSQMTQTPTIDANSVNWSVLKCSIVFKLFLFFNWCLAQREEIHELDISQMPQMAGGDLFLMMSHKLNATYSTFKLRRSLYDRKVSEANGERTTYIHSWAESSPD